MDVYTDIIAPTVTFSEEYHESEVALDDYLGQRIRGSEIVSCDVQQYRNFDG